MTGVKPAIPAGSSSGRDTTSRIAACASSHGTAAAAAKMAQSRSRFVAT